MLDLFANIASLVFAVAFVIVMNAYFRRHSLHTAPPPRHTQPKADPARVARLEQAVAPSLFEVVEAAEWWAEHPKKSEPEVLRVIDPDRPVPLHMDPVLTDVLGLTTHIPVQSTSWTRYDCCGCRWCDDGYIVPVEYEAIMAPPGQRSRFVSSRSRTRSTRTWTSSSSVWDLW